MTQSLIFNPLKILLAEMYKEYVYNLTINMPKFTFIIKILSDLMIQDTQTNTWMLIVINLLNGENTPYFECLYIFSYL